MKKNHIIIGITFSILFAILSSLYYGFVLDDAFIIYRYALNLAWGHGIVWNPGSEPVEGYTSFLWVIINCAAVLVDIDPVIFSKIISMAAALVVIWILAVSGKNLHWSLSAIFVSALALSPCFALLTMQGLETALTTLLLLAAAGTSLALFSKPSAGKIIALFALAFIGFLARPDTCAFTGPLLGATMFLFVREKNKNALLAFFGAGAVFALAFSLYTAWRVNYFGSAFPTTFYVKLAVGGSLFRKQGAWYCATFIKDVLFPYLVLIMFLLTRRFVKEDLLKIAPIILGGLGFGLYITTTYPIQGFCWRYIFPVYPSFLLAAIYYFSGPGFTIFKRGGGYLSFFVVLMAFVWTLHTLPLTLYEIKKKTTRDRAIVGKRLAGLPGTMFVSDSGALPYYSGWNSVDILGLTSQKIAREGLFTQTLVSIDPDLIMLMVGSGKYNPRTYERKLVNKYMIEHGFVVVAATHKSEDRYHLYFVRPDSGIFNETVDRLLDIKDLKYGNLDGILMEKRIPVYKQKD